MMEKINLLIVDDHFMFLQGLQSILKQNENINISGIASDGEEALKFLAKNKVDLVITDISMPQISGVELVMEIQRLYPKTSTLVLSMHNDHATITKLIQLNVNGYLLKNAEKQELLKAIETIAQGENYFSDEVRKVYMDGSFNRQKTTLKPELSLREIDVIKLIVDEFTAKEIAEKLCISVHTVESHRKNILSKLNVKNVAGLVKFAIENNYVN